MNKLHEPKPGISIESARTRAQDSSEFSRQRREAAAKARRSKIMRRVVAGVVSIGVGAGGGYAINHSGSDAYHPRTTIVKPGDTLSNIANSELQKQGVEDPGTEQIRQYVGEIAEANPDKVTGSIDSASAPVGDTLTLPKR